MCIKSNITRIYLFKLLWLKFFINIPTLYIKLYIIATQLIHLLSSFLLIFHIFQLFLKLQYLKAHHLHGFTNYIQI